MNAQLREADRGSVIMLLRHDARIAANSVRASCATWSDRLGVLFILTFLPGLGYLWLYDLPQEHLLLVVMVAGLLVGFTTLQLALSRLSYHRTDGVLAGCALCGKHAAQYLIVFLASAAAMAGLLLAALNFEAVPYGVAAIAAGAALSAMVRLLMHLGSQTTAAVGNVQNLREWLRRPQAGIAFAVLFALAGGLATRVFSPEGMLALCGVLTFLSCILLAQVDYQTVRFLAQSGYSPFRSFLVHQRGFGIFSILSPVIALPLAGIDALLITGLICLGAQTFMLIRILTFRIMSRQLAEWQASAMLALFAFVGFFAPMILIPVMAISIFGTWRRARHTGWLIA